MKIGDVILHPHGSNRRKSMRLVCVIIAINPEPERGYFILANLKKNGTPSKNRQKWQYLHIYQLERCQPHNKYPHVYTCPDCQIAGYTLVEAPTKIRKDGYYQCIMCKQKYMLKNDELVLL